MIIGNHYSTRENYSGYYEDRVLILNRKEIKTMEKTKKALVTVGLVTLGVIGGLVGYKKCKVNEPETIELDSVDEDETVDEN